MDGIDVSSFQPSVDWNKVKAAGVKFAIVRAGYGKKTKDKCMDSHAKGIINAGLGLGFYWFIYGTTTEHIIKNAEYFIKCIEPYKDKITHKVWCDFEYDTDRYANDKGIAFTKTIRTEYVKIFCEYLHNAGYDVGVYANEDYLKNHFNDLSMYPLWFAKYSEPKTKDCYMWQYSSKGQIDGIPGNVDVNIFYGEDVKDVEPVNIEMNVLKRGDKGEQVKTLQRLLISMKYSCGIKGVDGSFGKATLSAVEKYQKKNGLLVDGIVGANTWNSLLK